MENPRQTSFYQAMRNCEGVLLVLDQDAIPFKRIWCNFELSMVVRDTSRDDDDQLFLDVATVRQYEGTHGFPKVST